MNISKFETEQARLRELETQESQPRQTMPGISGAIQVLEDAPAETEGGDAAGSSAPSTPGGQ